MCASHGCGEGRGGSGDSTWIKQYRARSIIAYDSRQYHKLKAMDRGNRESRSPYDSKSRKVERACFPAQGCWGPRAWLSGWIYWNQVIILYGVRSTYISGQGIVQSGLVPLNYPYTVLTSVVEMKPKGTC